MNRPWTTRVASSGTDQAASPARNPSSRSRAVSRPRGPASTAKRRCPSATIAWARACAPAAFSGRIVSTPSRSWPTHTARPPERVKAAISARSASRAAASSDRLPIRITARARWARISATYSRSAASEADAGDMQTSSRLASATSMRPAAIEEKYGSAMSWTTTPTIVLCPVATARACRLAV